MSVVSVIIPVYNAEKTIKRCLESVVNQTYSDLEIVVVNDGSTDKSLEIIKRFEYDNRVKVIDKPNGGVSSARNVGIDNSVGEYICFVDADDYLEHGAISVAVATMTDDNADIVCYGYNIIYDGKTKKVKMPHYIDIADEQMYDSHISGYYSIFVWNKLYKRQVIIKYFNEYYSRCEDFLFNSQFYGGLIKISVIPDTLYNFTISGNTLRTIFPDDFLTKLEIIIDKICKNINITIESLPSLCALVYFKILKYVSSKPTKQERQKALEDSATFRKQLLKHAKAKHFKEKLCLFCGKLNFNGLAAKLAKKL